MVYNVGNFPAGEERIDACPTAADVVRGGKRLSGGGEE